MMKTFTKKGLILLMSLMIGSALMAQHLQGTLSSELVESGKFLNDRACQADDGVYLQQVGLVNQAMITQWSALYGGNSADIVQDGFFESVILRQYGRGNLADFYQAGGMNTINVYERGNNISSIILQAGVGNSVYQELGSDGMNYRIIQLGLGHEVIDLGFKPVNPGYRIVQTGIKGMKITIQHR